MQKLPPPIGAALTQCNACNKAIGHALSSPGRAAPAPVLAATPPASAPPRPAPGGRRERARPAAPPGVAPGRTPCALREEMQNAQRGSL